ncbi:MAG: hypothetical protein H6721_03415 [Sandaracinus sp.]|nr:hypothetical protein [Myxococcales bacterium]MCB9615579.1 hypothetical protein [Sandaracinus sp.]MCB9624014.1 hypothetical protein [Sandaracinus sp.]MCB9631182.1 hypothetical protein [Sandaracinus sp.]
MFAIELDEARGFAALWLGPPPTSGDWEAYLNEIKRLNAVVRRDLRPVVVQFLSGFQVPDALVRKKLGEVRGGIRPDVINAVVTDSLRVRAAQTAIDWWHKPHYDSSTHGTLDEALARVESSLGRPAPELRGLCERVLRRVGAPLR